MPARQHRQHSLFVTSVVGFVIGDARDAGADGFSTLSGDLAMLGKQAMNARVNRPMGAVRDGGDVGSQPAVVAQQIERRGPRPFVRASKRLTPWRQFASVESLQPAGEN